MKRWIALMGLTMQDAGQALGAMLGGGHVNDFSISGRSYRVTPQSSSAAASTSTS